MILIKGDALIFQTDTGRMIDLPTKSGIIHDPDGEDRPKCEVFFGPYRILRQRPTGTTRAATKYFGSRYKPAMATVDLPKGPWEPIAKVVKIFYKRGLRGADHAGGFHHPFARTPLTLSKCGRYWRLSLPQGCIVDDRGFVFP